MEKLVHTRLYDLSNTGKIHWLDIAASLPKNVGSTLFNKLPDQIKLKLKRLIILLKEYLLKRAVYSVEEFLWITGLILEQFMFKINFALMYSFQFIYYYPVHTR